MLYSFTRARLRQATIGHTSTVRFTTVGSSSTMLPWKRRRGKMFRRMVLVATTIPVPTVSCTSTEIIQTSIRSPLSVVSSQPSQVFLCNVISFSCLTFFSSLVSAVSSMTNNANLLITFVCRQCMEVFSM